MYKKAIFLLAIIAIAIADKETGAAADSKQKRNPVGFGYPGGPAPPFGYPLPYGIGFNPYTAGVPLHGAKLAPYPVGYAPHLGGIIAPGPFY